MEIKSIHSGRSLSRGGGNVGILGPSSRLKPEELERAVSVLESEFGLNVSVFPSVLEFLPPQDRAQEILRAAFDPDYSFLLCARGGEGCADVIPFLEPFKAQFKQASSKKSVMGISDSTPLLLFLAECGWPTFYGHVAAFFSRELTSVTRQSFQDFLKGEWPEIPLKPLNDLAKQGPSLEAEVTGGNLTLLELSLKESWEFDATGKILLMEDWHEKAYALDRLFKHFERIQKFSGVKALLLGDFIGNLPSANPAVSEQEKEAIQKVLSNFAARCHFPVFSAAYVGHIAEIRPILLGKARIVQLDQSRWALKQKGEG